MTETQYRHDATLPQKERAMIRKEDNVIADAELMCADYICALTTLRDTLHEQGDIDASYEVQRTIKKTERAFKRCLPALRQPDAD